MCKPVDRGMFCSPGCCRILVVRARPLMTPCCLFVTGLCLPDARCFTPTHAGDAGADRGLSSFVLLISAIFGAFASLTRQRDNVYRYKDEAKRLFAIRFNPHYNRRMHLASAKGQLVHIWHLEDKAASASSTRGVRGLGAATAVHRLLS